MKTLLLKFSGPLQSWGTKSNFNTRNTDPYPSKSAVIGLIAASLGYRRDQETELIKLNELDFAVRVYQPGNICCDYHIVRVCDDNDKPKTTYVTNRYYIEDGVFVVAISHRDESYIDMIDKGLKHPYFQPFMGRRSLPLPIDFILGKTDEGAIESLEKLDWKASKWYKVRNNDQKVSLEVYADSKLISSKSLNLKKDRPISFSFTERKFGFRYEAITIVEVDNKEEENVHIKS